MSSPEAASNSILGHQDLIPIRDVPRLLPRRSNGKPLHISACYRWITRGVRGVKLEIVRIGGSTYTSHEALARFASALTPNGCSPIPQDLPRRRQRQIEAAATRVQSLLIDRSRGRPRQSGTGVNGTSAAEVRP